MQLFQNIKKFVPSMVQAFSSLKNWLWRGNEPIQTDNKFVALEENDLEDDGEREASYFIPLISPSLVGLCAIGIVSKNAFGLSPTCKTMNPLPKKDDEEGPSGASFTWATPPQPLDNNILVHAAACAA